MGAHDIWKGIAADVHAGKPRRAKVRSILNYYGLKRRREAGIAAVRKDLAHFKLETAPDFAVAGMDDQVRFVPAGSKSLTPEPEPSGPPPRYALEPEPSSEQLRYRVLLRTFDIYDRLQRRLVDERLASVPHGGQNPRREDRDRFPFYLTVELRKDGTEEQLEGWVQQAASLEEKLEEADEPETPAVETPTGDGVAAADLADLREHLGALHADLRAAFGEQVRELEQRLNRKVEEIRFQAIRDLAVELKNDEALKFVQDYENEIAGKLEDKDCEIAEYVQEIGLLEARIREYEEAVDETEYDPEDAYPTLADTVRLFMDLAQGSPVLVLDAAIRSAARSASVRRREVLQFLLTLKELAEQLYSRGGAGKSLREWFEDRGIDYAQGDSETTGTKHGKEREIVVDGAKVQMEEHVTLFPNSPNCVSVYFYRDQRAKRLVVGYVGPHLRTVSR